MRYYRLLCWVPAALWVWARLITARYDGWGAWAAAPVLLVPVAVSSLAVGVGLLSVGRSPQGRRGSRQWDWMAIGVSALPLLWFGLRLIRR